MFDSIAYSRIANDNGPINTAEHFRYCATLPFTSLKADLRPTADGGVILCHDKGFTLDENGRIAKFDKDSHIKILEMTTEQCLALEHCQPYDGAYCKVTDFESFIRICKACGKAPFITVRDEAIESVIAVVLPVLEKYGLTERSIINSFTVSTLEAFRHACPGIRLSYVLRLRKVIERSDVDTALRLGNCLVTSFHFTSANIDDGWEPLEASKDGIAYAAENGVAVYQAQVGSAVPLEQLTSRGYSGAQLLYAPNFAE